MKQNNGFLQGQDVLGQILKRIGQEQQTPEMFYVEDFVLETVKDDFCDWLGESKYMYGFKNIPPSRFSSSNSNGMWEYSPFLCGVGLLEGLEIAYLAGAHLMETLTEPTILLHLHNSLVQKGYLKRQIGLWGVLEDVFCTEFFGHNGAPTTDFLDAYTTCATKHSEGTKRRRQRLKELKGTSDVPEFLTNIKAHALFRQKPLSLLLREADWDPRGLPEDDLRVTSLLGFYALARTKDEVNSMTGEKRLAETDLVQRARAIGMDDEFIRKSASVLSKTQETPAGRALDMVRAEIEKAHGKPRQPCDSKAKPWVKPSSSLLQEPSFDHLLDMVKQDVTTEVAGEHPTLGMSYLWIIMQVLMICFSIEDQLKAAGNSSYQTIYGPGSPFPQNTRRSALLVHTLQVEDPECLKIMADVLWKHRTGVKQNLYWKKLQLREDPSMRVNESENALPDCILM